MCVFLIFPVPIAEPLTSEIIDTPVFYNLAPRPIKYRVSVPIPTAQWIEDSFEMRRVMLNAQECPGSHTGAAIASALESMFVQWNITKDMVHVVLRDNGRNMVKAIKDCGLNSLGCIAHTLQLAVHEGVLSQHSISDCMAIGRRIVGHFKHSHLAMSRLGEIQTELGLSKKMLQQDTLTRWNSTFYMMSSLLVQKRALGAYGAEFELPASFSVYQWGLIENVVTLLVPFEELTQYEKRYVPFSSPCPGCTQILVSSLYQR